MLLVHGLEDLVDLPELGFPVFLEGTSDSQDRLGTGSRVDRESAMHTKRKAR